MLVVVDCIDFRAVVQDGNAVIEVRYPDLTYSTSARESTYMTCNEASQLVTLLLATFPTIQKALA